MKKFLNNFFVTFTILSLFAVAIITGVMAVIFYFDREEAISSRIDTETALRAANSDINDLTVENEDLTEQLALIGDEPTDACFNRSVNAWIVNNTPCASRFLGNSYTLKGVAFGLFENTLLYSLELEDGTVLNSGVVTYTAPDLGVPGTYEEVISWTPPADLTAETAILYLFGQSPEDGSREHIVTIPVDLIE